MGDDLPEKMFEAFKAALHGAFPPVTLTWAECTDRDRQAWEAAARTARDCAASRESLTELSAVALRAKLDQVTGKLARIADLVRPIRAKNAAAGANVVKAILDETFVE